MLGIPMDFNRPTNLLLGREKIRQQSPYGRCVFGGICFVVVIEIDPSSFRATGPDPLGPSFQLHLRIVMPVPALVYRVLNITKAFTYPSFG